MAAVDRARIKSLQWADRRLHDVLDATKPGSPVHQAATWLHWLVHEVAHLTRARCDKAAI